MRIFSLLAVFGILVGGCGSESTEEIEWGDPPQCNLSYVCQVYNLCRDNGQCNCFAIDDCWSGEPYNSTHYGYMSCCME
jgi:hypothetical protein